MEEFESLLEKYNSLGIIQSKEEFEKAKIEFTFHSNRLEGSNLTLIQTQEILNTHKAKGEISITDSLMAIDNYRALGQALTYGANKYPLSEKMLLDIHKTLFKNTFELDPAYHGWKEKGQDLGEYKIKENRILVAQNEEEKYYSTPTPKEAKKLILASVESYNSSSEPFLNRLSKLIQNVYNAHAFFDGNKRMTRLIIAQQLMKNGLPLVVLHKNKNAYNEALIDGFINNSHNKIEFEIVQSFNQYLAEKIQAWNAG